MVQKAQKAKSVKGNGAVKPKAVKLDIGQLVVIAAYAKTFSTGKRGFFGKVLDPQTGKRYQVTAAVELS